ncbi:MAG: hypothetical protein IT583_05290 [Verrucomicrobia bacterium]|nr:hypothetical protein [Verrucomicrobiota bacterium]
MQNVFIDYPEVPWKEGWRLFSGPEDTAPLATGSVSGALTALGAAWTLQLIAPEAPCKTRLFSNGFSINARKNPEQCRIDALMSESGVLYGRVIGLPMPQLTAEADIREENGLVWANRTLLLLNGNRFVLVCNAATQEQALAKAESVLKENFETLVQSETARRELIGNLFSINPRHNAPVALAAESLSARLRESTGALHGLWSIAEGFSGNIFSLNELYPLVRAWNLIDPSVALKLAQTALSLQQTSGGFPSWANADGLVSPVAPWPFIAQAFELAWQNGRDPALLKKHLPALRKYVQWALRHFDPHHDRIPAWQSEQEIFVPQHFERGKATPELTVLLIAEIEAVLRLCEASEHAEPVAASLSEERDQLVRTLNTIFWNPAAKAFSNVWKVGHYIHEPTFGSFMPLFWRGIDPEKQTVLLERFEETHGFPGHTESNTWKQEVIDDTAHLPAIHQFMALEALRNTGGDLLMLFVRRAREGFAVWFERESIEAARGDHANNLPAYALGPVTAALVLTAQAEFERETARTPSAARQFLRWVHRWRISKTDLRIALTVLLAILIVHLAYTIPHNRDAKTRVAEAAMAYQHGHYAEALRICRRYPNNALAQFLQANLLMRADRPVQAEELYRKALIQETESPSALFGLALALQLNGDFSQAEKRYTDFLDIHEARYPEAAQLADEFLRLSREKFRRPPDWKRVYGLPMMNDL